MYFPVRFPYPLEHDEDRDALPESEIFPRVFARIERNRLPFADDEDSSYDPEISALLLVAAMLLQSRC